MMTLVCFFTSPSLEIYASGGINNKNLIIIQSQKIAAYDEAIKGFKDEWKGKDVTIKETYDLGGNVEEGRRVIQTIKNDRLKPDLILTVGILATILAKEQFPDIPIVFCMVINHERFNLQDDNVFGVSLDAAVGDQFAVFRELIRSYKRIGIIYDPVNTGKIVSEAALVARNTDMRLLMAEVTSHTEVESALRNMIGKIDALWIVPDVTVITKDSLDNINKVALKHRLPTFCTSDILVKQGILLSVSADYTSIGVQAARLSGTLLNSPAIMPQGIQRPEKLRITINRKTAERIGVDVSPFQSRSDVVFYP